MRWNSRALQRRALVPAAALVLGGGWLVACDGDGEEAAGGAGAFSFADDDLCQWVSEAEVAEFVAAEFDWDGTARELSNKEGAACQWELSSQDGTIGAVSVRDGALSEDFDGNPVDFDEGMEAEGTLDYRGPVCIGEFVTGHPALSDGVVVHNGGFGQFFFAVPPDTSWLLLSLDVPGQPGDDWTSCEGGITTGGVVSEHFEPRFFAVANHFLDELGWLSTA